MVVSHERRRRGTNQALQIESFPAVCSPSCAAPSVISSMLSAYPDLTVGPIPDSFETASAAAAYFPVLPSCGTMTGYGAGRPGQPASHRKLYSLRRGVKNVGNLFRVLDRWDWHCVLSLRALRSNRGSKSEAGAGTGHQARSDANRNFKRNHGCRRRGWWGTSPCGKGKTSGPV